MAIGTPTNLATSGSSTDASSYSSASITPTANRVVIAAVCSLESGLSSTNTATISGCSLTWEQIANDTVNARRVTVFKGIGASPTAETVTFDFAGQTQLGGAWTIFEFDTNASAANPIVQVATNTGTVTSALTVTLGAFSNALNATVGIFGTQNRDYTVGSGFTQIGEAQFDASIFSEFRADNDTTVDMTLTASGNSVVGVALELRHVVAPAPHRRIDRIRSLLVR